jgi:hypothetical protein
LSSSDYKEREAVSKALSNAEKEKATKTCQIDYCRITGVNVQLQLFQ